MRAWHPVGAAVLLAAAVGCSSGPKVASVKGQLQDNGAPLKVSTAGLPPGDKGIRVEFVQLKEGGGAADKHSATVSPEDGTFTVPGPKGNGIPPGKYRVSVYRGAFGTGDVYKGTFGESNSPLTADIPPTGANLLIDVGTKQVKAQ